MGAMTKGASFGSSRTAALVCFFFGLWTCAKDSLYCQALSAAAFVAHTIDPFLVQRSLKRCCRSCRDDWQRSNSCTIARRTPLYSSQTDDNNDDILSRRIQQLQQKEAEEARALSRSLSTRIEELRQSEAIWEDDLTITATTTKVVRLPVLCLDALLPLQILEGRTEDSNFGVFLRQLGLGGWFVMTSLDPTTRKLRRHGCLTKIMAVDALKLANDGMQQQQQQDRLTSIPTAVDFQLRGYARCRIIGDLQGMKQRMGRWRRGYDPNGEQAVLGWGEERFVDASSDLILDPVHEETSSTGAADDLSNLACSEWNDLPVLVHLEALPEDDHDATEIETKVQQLSALVDEWYALASNTDTYNNMNVTAATRIRPGHPGLWVEPDKLLARVLQQLGPRPNEATAFCFWAAALINPLPALGVSLEIRGRLLEAPTARQRLQVLELGLRRSIDNLRGRRPLV